MLALLLVIAVVLILPILVQATPDPYLTGSNTATGYSNSAMPITDLQVAGTGNPTVPVKLRATSGTLAMSTTTGLTFSGASTGSTLQFSGSLSNVNSALATLTYTRNGTGTDTLEASLVNAGEVFFPDNNHLYEYVSYSATWNNANTNAQTRTKYGATGYLTTITSQAENEFVAERLLNAGWMGASDATSEGDWKWVTGPENGTSFWSGLSNGSAVSGRYSNWGTGEPNDSSGEDCAQFLTGSSGKWNDLPCSSYALPGYVVEYGSDSSPIEIASLNIAITTNAANNYPSTPSSLGPSAKVNDSWSSDTTPTFSFTLSDPDVANTVGYRIQVDNDSDFSSPVVDYTSALAAQGATGFTVGQSAGSGSYTTGTFGQTLTDGLYYWRVRASDSIGADSSYTTANSGSVAFRIDTTDPTIPGTPSAVSPTLDTTPTITWAASSDAGSGLNSTAYQVEWSQQSDFSGAVSATSAATSFTIPTLDTLDDGIWYFRVLARDAVLNFSDYSETVNVIVDTTAPTVPGTPQVSTSTNNNLPSWSWTASSDAGSGLATQAYMFEWSQSADFTGTIYTTAAPNTSYTHTARLSDGTWYVRVKAVDQLDHESSYSGTGKITIDTSAKVTSSISVSQQRITPNRSQSTVVAAGGDLTTPTQGIIFLNDFKEYTRGKGKPLNLANGQVIYFAVDTDRHSATVKAIAPSYVIVTVASTPTDVRVERGQSLDYDVDKDGSDDIQITYHGMRDGAADMTFKQLVAQPVAVIDNKSGYDILSWWWLIIVPLLLVVFAKRRKKSAS